MKRKFEEISGNGNIYPINPDQNPEITEHDQQNQNKRKRVASSLGEQEINHSTKIDEFLSYVGTLTQSCCIFEKQNEILEISWRIISKTFENLEKHVAMIITGSNSSQVFLPFPSLQKESSNFASK